MALASIYLVVVINILMTSMIGHHWVFCEDLKVIENQINEIYNKLDIEYSDSPLASHHVFKLLSWSDLVLKDINDNNLNVSNDVKDKISTLSELIDLRPEKSKCTSDWVNRLSYLALKYSKYERLGPFITHCQRTQGLLCRSNIQTHIEDQTKNDHSVSAAIAWLRLFKGRIKGLPRQKFTLCSDINRHILARAVVDWLQENGFHASSGTILGNLEAADTKFKELILNHCEVITRMFKDKYDYLNEIRNRPGELMGFVEIYKQTLDSMESYNICTIFEGTRGQDWYLINRFDYYVLLGYLNRITDTTLTGLRIPTLIDTVVRVKEARVRLLGESRIAPELEPYLQLKELTNISLSKCNTNYYREFFKALANFPDQRNVTELVKQSAISQIRACVGLIWSKVAEKLRDVREEALNALRAIRIWMIKKLVSDKKRKRDAYERLIWHKIPTELINEAYSKLNGKNALNHVNQGVKPDDEILKIIREENYHVLAEEACTIIHPELNDEFSQILDILRMDFGLTEMDDFAINFAIEYNVCNSLPGAESTNGSNESS